MDEKWGIFFTIILESCKFQRNSSMLTPEMFKNWSNCPQFFFELGLVLHKMPKILSNCADFFGIRARPHNSLSSFTSSHKRTCATLGPTYNEQFDAQNCSRSSRVFVVTEIFNTAVKETALVYIVNYLFVVAGCSL